MTSRNNLYQGTSEILLSKRAQRIYQSHINSYRDIIIVDQSTFIWNQYNYLYHVANRHQMIKLHPYRSCSIKRNTMSITIMRYALLGSNKWEQTNAAPFLKKKYLKKENGFKIYMCHIINVFIQELYIVQSAVTLN